MSSLLVLAHDELQPSVSVIFSVTYKCQHVRICKLS